MVTGKPPRRSTPSKEPVTIDLDAKDINRVETDPATAESVQPAPQDEPVPAPVTEEVVFASEEPLKMEQTAETDIPQSEPETSAGDDASGPPPPPQDEPAPATGDTFGRAPASTVNVRKPATATLVAAGILGGLVALALAGSMQYAGYLPSAGEQTPATTAQGPDIAALTAEVDGLKQQLANIPATPAAGDTGALEARIAALESSSANAGQTAAADPAVISALEQKIAALQTGLDEAKAAASGSESNAASLARRLDEAERKLNEPRDDVEVARAIASAALKATIDRGGPFLTELETLAGVVPDDPSIAALRPLAAAGVPSRAELLRQYPDAANAILEALHAPDPNEGILDRLRGSAMSLVKVRPVGNVAGESPDAIVARIEDKMRNGDLEGAALEWNSLPEAGKSVSAAFKQALDARISVENLVNGALNRAVTSTGQQG